MNTDSVRTNTSLTMMRECVLHPLLLPPKGATLDKYLRILGVRYTSNTPMHQMHIFMHIYYIYTLYTEAYTLDIHFIHRNIHTKYTLYTQKYTR